MALNVDQLKAGLHEYHEGLENYISQTQSGLDELQQHFGVLQSQYDGQGAREFAANWKATEDWLETHLKTMRELDELLIQRTQELHPV